ncbi:MAG TPA: hypothetical protein PK289_01195 [Bacteroidia bacterium]|nr:hypothetical protein [Bacteroidia bacterium]
MTKRKKPNILKALQKLIKKVRADKAAGKIKLPDNPDKNIIK